MVITRLEEVFKGFGSLETVLLMSNFEESIVRITFILAQLRNNLTHFETLI